MVTHVPRRGGEARDLAKCVDGFAKTKRAAKGAEVSEQMVVIEESVDSPRLPASWKRQSPVHAR